MTYPRTFFSENIRFQTVDDEAIRAQNSKSNVTPRTAWDSLRSLQKCSGVGRSRGMSSKLPFKLYSVYQAAPKRAEVVAGDLWHKLLLHLRLAVCPPDQTTQHRQGLHRRKCHKYVGLHDRDCEESLVLRSSFQLWVLQVCECHQEHTLPAHLPLYLGLF